MAAGAHPLGAGGHPKSFDPNAIVVMTSSKAIFEGT